MDRYENRNYWSDEPPKLSERELLEWAAGISPRAEAELRRLRWAEAEAKENARRDRELLEFTAAISGKPEHERELRALLKKEAEERESQLRSLSSIEEKYVEADHPRWPKGTPEGGEWAKKGGGGATDGAPPQVPKPDPSELLAIILGKLRSNLSAQATQAAKASQLHSLTRSSSAPNDRGSDRRRNAGHGPLQQHRGTIAIRPAPS